ncbi:MAG: hypothetical protein ACTHP8_02175 [Bosea sp. (in: a-proteobacteria)]|uniref:hypothetical protein n=1 Tax=Bosea sp. (in: a-proteobacteria) TaxID=1871050 RepID=UPI001ACCC7E6|nr:hypothetical protein [Bosea sp. (in: a-proteobacteria)]MBN9445178.1 hypothetical protein [Bosea sp. (in: a-proteobacteria)]MBN9458380.1 hypothetical protein [Bosea sp. (in: a-proteobacteria)]
MMSLRKKWIVALTAASVAAGTVAVPAMAQTSRSFDPARLDKAQAAYSQYRHRHYRGGWRGPSRGGAIAAGIGLGILGAAAAAASARSYDPYYDGYYAAPPPVYVAPRYAPYGYYAAPYDFRDDRYR